MPTIDPRSFGSGESDVVSTNCTAFKVSDLEQSHFNEKARFFYNMWRRQTKNGDCDFEDFVPFSPELIVLGKPNASAPMANLVFSGENTIGARMFGQNLEKKSAEVYAGLDKYVLKNYSETVSIAQNDSFETCEPIFDYISSEFGAQTLAYERLLLPFKTKAGPVFLVAYSMPVSVPSF